MNNKIMAWGDRGIWRPGRVVVFPIVRQLAMQGRSRENALLDNNLTSHVYDLTAPRLLIEDRKEKTMLIKSELKTVLKHIGTKKNDVLNSKKGSDLDYLKNLQTLIKLESAANKELKKLETNK